MSLTSHLDNPISPVRQWMDLHVPVAQTRPFVRSVNDQLAAVSPLVADGTDPMLAGTAFDYGFRWFIGPLDARVARSGATFCTHYYDWSAAPDLVRMILSAGNRLPDLQTRARYAVVLAWFERVYRDGQVPPALEPFIGRPGTRATMNAIVQAAPAAVVHDVATLLTTVPTVWGNDLQRSFVLNPTFSGSDLVGGADADWIMETTLYECKVSKKTRPFERSHLLQTLGYFLLDAYDELSIRSLGWYFPRQQHRIVYPLPELLTRLCGRADSAALRADFYQEVFNGVWPPDGQAFPEAMLPESTLVPVLIELLEPNPRRDRSMTFWSSLRQRLRRWWP